MAVILVADDHPLNRHFLATLLSYYGHQVREAEDGIEALAAARQERPDVIIMDVAMPRMDGPALVRALRLDRDLADIPLIFYSASHREVESRAMAQAAGVEHVIGKPADPEAILATVRRALGHTERTASGRRRISAERAREYVGRLQLAGIRMSALIELTLDLSAERDPHELLRTACLAIRTIFGVDYAVIAIAGVWGLASAGPPPPAEAGGPTDWATDGAVDQGRLDELFVRMTPYAGSAASRASGADEPLVAAARTAMPEVWSALFLRMMTRDRLYGWVLLGKRHDAHPFNLDDERLALAAASQIRAEHESLRAERAERQRIEAELRAYREDLAALVDASPVGIIAFDRDLIVRSWNAEAERTFGWRAEEAIGRPNPAIPPDQGPEFERRARECLAGTTIAGVEQRRIRKDGLEVDVTVSMAPLHDAQGMTSGFVSIVNDVTDLHASRERLRAISARVLSIQEEERSRLARELHDDLGQLLTAIKIDAARLVQEIARGAAPPPRLLEGLLPLIDTTMDTVVRIVSELRPSRIGEMGLAAAIRMKCTDFRQRTEIECEVSIEPESIQVHDDVATAIFRILEEALTNVARHSGATRVEVRLAQSDDQLLLEVRDNGRGIRDAERTAAGAYGLIGMKERAVIFGGTVEITAAEGRGTVVTARIPLGHDPRLHR